MEYSAKISLIGDEFVGKTSVINRFINNTFSPDYKTTMGADFIDKTFNSKDLKSLKDGDKFNLTIWDMAGQAHFVEIASLYLEGSLGVIIVFDVTNPTSFSNIKEWIAVKNKICPSADVRIIGNKSDLESKITPDEIKATENKFKIPIEFSSAKDGDNVESIFTKIAEDMLKKHVLKK